MRALQCSGAAPYDRNALPVNSNSMSANDRNHEYKVIRFWSRSWHRWDWEVRKRKMNRRETELVWHGTVWFGMIFTHLGSVHARQADVNRLVCQSCIVFFFFWGGGFIVIGLESYFVGVG